MAPQVPGQWETTRPPPSPLALSPSQKAPELWAKVTAPAARETCDHLNTAEVEQAAQSGHCAKRAGSLAKPRPTPSWPDPFGTLIYRGPSLGRVSSSGPGGGGACSETQGEVGEKEASGPVKRGRH